MVFGKSASWRNTGLLLLSCGIPLCGMPLCEADEDLAYLNLNLEQLLDVPVTGSTLTEESLKTVPSVVTVFTHEQIDRLGLDYL
ncbi:MAG TPA: hypothetical protein VLE50_10880, partial [Cellvibrio sp.]|nr:hypothetical protein [Cellvibrio sp.]